MLFMVLERFKSQGAKAVYERACARGRMLPDGVRYVTSWVDAELARCFQVMEAPDAAHLAAWTARWEDLVEFEIVPVLTSAEAFTRVLGPDEAARARQAALDGEVHHAVLLHAVEHGHAPAADAIAAALGVPVGDVTPSLARLHEGHGLVLHPGTHDVWVAHPFSFSPTAVWVAPARPPASPRAPRGHWAPCLWCALGIATLAVPDAVVTTRLGGEDEPVAIRAAGAALEPSDLVVHFAVRPALAWDNVVHFCATVQPFARAADVDAWCARHRLPRGEIVPLAQVHELARAWYGHHLDRAWRKWSVTEAQAIFDRVGLRSAFWRLGGGEGPY
jgi:hypothetical protein